MQESENHDRGTDLRELVHPLEVVVVQADTAMGHILAQKPRVERPMNEIAFAEPQGIISEHARLEAMLRIGGDAQPLFEKGPVRFDPDRIREL